MCTRDVCRAARQIQCDDLEDEGIKEMADYNREIKKTKHGIKGLSNVLGGLDIVDLNPS